MRVGIEARAYGKPTGFGTVVTNLINELLHIRSKHQYVLYSDRPISADSSNNVLDSANVRVLARRGPAWIQFALPLQLRAADIDAFLFTTQSIPIIPTGCPAVAFLHDLTFLRVANTRTLLDQWWAEARVRMYARRCCRLICVSENTRRDALELLGIPPSRCVTALLGSDHVPQMDKTQAGEILSRAGLSPHQPYAICVAAMSPSKNIPTLIHAFARARSCLSVPLSLVWVANPGYGWKTVHADVQRALRADSVEEFVHIYKGLSSRELAALIKMAQFLVLPSLYEGFGLPVVEAMALGVPTAVSNAGSLPEVVQDAALTFDPTNVDAIASTIMRLGSSDELRSDFARRGLRRASQLTWRQTATSVDRVFDELEEDLVHAGRSRRR